MKTMEAIRSIIESFNVHKNSEYTVFDSKNRVTRKEIKPKRKIKVVLYV